MNSSLPVICLRRAAMFMPDSVEDAESIAAAAALPVVVVRDKMGIRQKKRAPASLHPSEMAVRAAKAALEGIDPNSIDAILWTGSEYKDHIVWTAAIHVQREIGAKRAFSFDLSARCSTGILGVSLAKSMMQTNPALKRVLLCGGHRTGDLVNYQDPNTRFLFNLADGGSAMLLERAPDGVSEKDAINPVLDAKIITDGDFSLDVIIPAGGTKETTRAQPEGNHTYLTVPDVEGMRQRLDAVSLKNFLDVIRSSANQHPIDYLAILHMKRSIHDAILADLGLQQEQSTYLDDYGHFGSPDQVLSIGLAEKRGQLQRGHHVVLASAGLGYMWAACCIRWDAPVFTDAALAHL